MDIFLILFIYFNSCCVLWVAAACPRYQVSHTVAGKSVCCSPVFNCPIGHMINYCSTDGGRDKCVPCGEGMINNYTTSSLDPQHHVCFRMTESHKNCPIADTFPIASPVYCNTMYCSCDTSQCYYGDPCLFCDKAKTVCRENEELNPKTGVCEKCKELSRSPAGCGPCMFDEELWRQSEDLRNDTATSKMEQTTTKLTTKLTSVNKTFYVAVNIQDTINTGYIIVAENTTEPTKAHATKEDKFPIIPVIIVIVVLVLIGLLIALILYTRRQVQQGNENRLVAVYHKLHCKKNVPRSNPSDIEGNTENTETVEAGLTNGEVPRRVVASVKPMNCEQGATGEQSVGLLKESEGACGGTEDTDDATCRKTSTAS